ncbi:alpha/beta-hydrolase [Dissoconium aciculare CBS 342.82]|uniref:Alpha/beta-hydrolase n=1 Tax=Dissoconium aciculare CBS 342.82 TaxID=1314786 RepID=A0A6J3M8M4_9PEZI|nr:alpha/beta-hydrolase [Dissoconium aciculare CBS 342.82]KAF1824223.1 alpha/beta-hydrolase [Dissoconium aciculare CBS 342.82]
MSTGVGVSSCCLSGKLAEGTPKGHETTIGGLHTYVASPEDGKTTKSIVFITDIFGWELKNTRLLADNYARAGFTCYIPDVLEGDALPHDFLDTVEPNLAAREKLSLADKALNTAKVGTTFGPWLIRHREAVARPLIENFIRSVRMIPGTDKVGAIGFCWGGRYAILAAQKPFSGAEGAGIDAAYACHPSMVSIPADFEDIVVPVSFALGEKDSLLGEKEIGQIREVMAKKEMGMTNQASVSEIVVYPEQIHGFSLRGDWSSEKDKKAMDDAEKQGINWFNKHLS